MRSLNIYTRKYFTFVCAGLGSRRGEVMTASICILIITRKNDRSGNLAKKLSRRECCKLVAVKSFEPILPWLVRRLSGVTTRWHPLSQRLWSIYWVQPSNINISTHFSCILNRFSSINWRRFQHKRPAPEMRAAVFPPAGDRAEHWSYYGPDSGRWYRICASMAAATPSAPGSWAWLNN